MTPEQYKRACEVYHAVVALGETERAAFIETACAGDPELLAEIESLLDARTRAADFLEPRLEDEPSPLVGRSIGQYEIIRELAAGGMGTVYEAQQREPSRRVALKVVRSGGVGRAALARFRHEAEILGRLTHPAIAQVHEAGTHRDTTGSIAYFTMELVEQASTITSYAAAKALPVSERLALYMRVCDAVAYAHQRGVIHRDLKPSNILVDRAGNPKVLDFGLAKLTQRGVSDSTVLTEAGQLLGTVSYMSPEQVAGDPAEVDTRSDVYSLGVILYELLAGRLPLDTSRVSLPEAMRAIREVDPPSLGTVDRSLRGDLETITAKALEKDRDRRYPFVSALADDLGRYLRREPITARPASAVYTLRRFAERNRALVVGTIAAVAILVAGIIGTTAGLVRANAATRLADFNAAQSRINEYRASVQAAGAALKTEDVPSALFHLSAAPPEHRGWEWRYLMAQADQSVATLTPVLNRSIVECELATSPDGSRMAVCNGSTVMLIDTATGATTVRKELDGAKFVFSQFNADGSRLLLTAGGLRRFVILDGRTLDILGQGPELGREVLCAAWSPDESLIAMGSGHWRNESAEDRLIRLFDATTFEQRRVLQSTGGRCERLAFLPDGKRLLSFEAGGVLVIWDLATGAQVPWPMAASQAITAFCLSADGTRLATAGSGGVQVWDSATRALLTNLGSTQGKVEDLTFGRSSQTLYAGDGAVLVKWDVDSGRSARRRGHRNEILKVRTCPAGQESECPITCSPTDQAGEATHEIKAWSFEAAGDFRTFDGYAGAALSPDGRLVIHADPTSNPGSGITNRTRLALLRDVDTGETLKALDSGIDNSMGNQFEFSAEGSLVVRTQRDGGLALWDVRSGARLGSVTLRTGDGSSVRFRPSVRGAAPPTEVVVTRGDASVGIHRVPDLAPLREIKLPTGFDAWRLDASAEGTYLAVGSRDGRMILLDAERGSVMRDWAAHQGEMQSMAFSPDERLVASTDATGIRIWNVASGSMLADWAGSAAALLFDRSQQTNPPPTRSAVRLFVGMRDGSVRVVGLFPQDAAATAGSLRPVELLQLRYQSGGGWLRGLAQSADSVGNPAARLFASRDWPAGQYYIWDSTPAAQIHRSKSSVFTAPAQPH